MDLIEDIGPILGIVAFLGFAILALLIVLQAREVRRLREWAGRAPERAIVADEAALAAGEAPADAAEERRPSRLRQARERVSTGFTQGWEAVDRRSPINPLWFLGAIVVALIAVGVVTSGFGLVGGGDDGEVTAEEPKSAKQGGGSGAVEVAVLNATQMEGVADPVPGIADLVANEIVRPADFKTGARTDALVGEEDSVIMFEPEAEGDAETLAEAVEPDLGRTEIVAMTEATRERVKGAPLALLVGFDDAELAGGNTATEPVP